MAQKVIYAVYEDPELLKDAARKLVTAGVKVRDVFSPFPVHGLDPIIGVKRTRLAIVAFMLGLMGTSLACVGTYWMLIVDWPMNIGGKPNDYWYQNVPAFVPIIFELTVFCAAHGVSITYLLRNKTLPGMPARNPDPRSTDDKFIIELRTDDNHGHSAEGMTELLRGTEVFEINERQY